VRLLGLLAAAALLGGCTGTPQGSSTHDTTSTSGTPTTVRISVKGNDVEPHADRIPVKVGQPVRLRITSDRGGELHVHSTPEQHIEYHTGTTTATVRIDRPGIVDIEDHVADVVVLQLEVS
jgi:hypothetical protein